MSDIGITHKFTYKLFLYSEMPTVLTVVRCHGPRQGCVRGQRLPCLALFGHFHSPCLLAVGFREKMKGY